MHKETALQPYEVSNGMPPIWMNILKAIAHNELIIKGEALYSMREGIPATSDTDPTVWVYDETRAQEAATILNELQHIKKQVDPSDFSWFCQACDEELQNQFTSCWNC